MAWKTDEMEVRTMPLAWGAKVSREFRIRFHSEHIKDEPVRNLEDLLTDSCGRLILLVLKEINRQNITGDEEDFQASADCLIETGHQITIEIRGKLPDETFLSSSTKSDSTRMRRNIEFVVKRRKHPNEADTTIRVEWCWLYWRCWGLSRGHWRTWFFLGPLAISIGI